MEVLRLAAAFVGLLVGAGFASGQEILQFFTAFGWAGTMGAVVAAMLFGALGMIIAHQACVLQARCHKEIVHIMCGPYVGVAVDWIITAFLIGVVVIMFAGSGALFVQQLGLPFWSGALFMLVITLLTMLLNITRVMNLMGALTPWLMALMLGLAIYAFSTMTQGVAQMDTYANPGKAAFSEYYSSWLFTAVLYVSFNITVGVPMLAVMGGSMSTPRKAAMGGMLGGLCIGALILIIHFGLMSRLDLVMHAELPILVLANEVAPWFSYVITFIVLGMIYNTAVGMLYSFAARIEDRESPRFNMYVVSAGLLAFVGSFVGFGKLVGTVYPITGVLGLLLIFSALWFGLRRRKVAVAV